jgi:hypothetical protein
VAASASGRTESPSWCPTVADPPGFRTTQNRRYEDFHGSGSGVSPVDEHTGNEGFNAQNEQYEKSIGRGSVASMTIGHS